MIGRTLTGLVLVCAGLAGVPGPPATASGPAVTLEDMRFTPASLTIPVGQSVIWGFLDAVPHTATSDQGFWESEIHSDGTTYSRTFDSAGIYPYHSRLHPATTGKVRVPVSRTGAPTAGWTLRWATDSATGVFDVQVRKGRTKWKVLANDTSATTASFGRTGTWSVRARTQIGSSVSSWSPVLKVTTSR